MAADILTRILDWKRQEVAQARQTLPLAELRQRVQDLPPTRALRSALRRSETLGTRIIAEIKKASPSAGLIRADFDPLAIATTYAQHGAAAISILTDAKFFQGQLAYLTAVRQAMAVPLLRKDFIIDPYQLYEARVFGADAVLLIATALDVQELIDLAALSLELGLEPLVEVHAVAELDKALECAARVIGINNRNLHTFHTDVATTVALLPHIPADYVVVSESGLKDRATIVQLEAHGVAAFLIGESLMREPDIGLKLDVLRGMRQMAEDTVV
jgi:indole-3-glycerol phosphate synthase